MNLNIEHSESTGWVRLRKPYKIVAIKEKLYREHYHIPASECLIVPEKRLDDAVSCCVYWQDNEGRHTLYNLMFTSENLEPVDSTGHESLFELWESLNR